MNRIISINIRGLIFQIEEDAFERLNQYFKKLKNHFRDQKGSDEIMDDIETRVAEMLSRDPGTQGVVNIIHVNAIIDQMGDPAQFDQEDTEAEPEQQFYQRRRRMLYRNGEQKVIGGVCSGIAAYFDIDPLLVRIGFLFAFFTFGTGLLLYIILWAIVPEARTASEKLEMRGEKVTIDNIEKSVKDEFERLKKNFDDPSFRNNAKQAVRSAGEGLKEGLGTFANILKRIFGFFLVTTILFILIAGGLVYFGLLSGGTPFFPFFNNLFEEPTYAILFKLSLAFLFVIPLLAILYAGVRLLLAIPGKSLWATRIMASLWLISLGGTILLSFNLAKGWRDHATLSKEQVLPKSDTLSIESTNISVYGQQEFNLEFGRSRGIRGIYAIENDSLKRPVQLNILPSEGSEMYLKVHRHANGPDYAAAAELASHIEHPLQVSEGKLLFNPYYSVPTSDVWKNQRLIYDLYVPEGVVLAFGKNTSTFLKHISTDNYIHTDHLEGKSFRMTRNGLLVKEGDNRPDDGGTEFHYTGFDEIKLNGIPEAMIYYSPDFQISAEPGTNYTPNFEQHGSELMINLPEGFIGHHHTGMLRIGLPRLKDIHINGGSLVSFDMDKQETLSIEINGTAQLDGSIRAHRLKIESNGLNTCKLSGSCYELDLSMNGAGDFDLKELQADMAEVTADGGGSVVVNAKKTLSARSNGLATITYHGNPVLQKTKVTGNGKIVRAD